MAIDADKSLSVRKTISIVFAQPTLQKAYEAIAAELRDIALKVESETTLVQEDNLARGTLIQPQSGSASLQASGGQEYWSFTLSQFETSLAEIGAVEFWGQRSHYVDDVIAGMSKYPWMPSTVSTRQWFE